MISASSWASASTNDRRFSYGRPNHPFGSFNPHDRCLRKKNLILRSRENIFITPIPSDSG